MWSEVTDEEFELTQFLGMEIDAKNEELILNINTRLQAVFEKLLQTINETANQVKLFYYSLERMSEWKRKK